MAKVEEKVVNVVVPNYMKFVFGGVAGWVEY